MNEVATQKTYLQEYTAEKKEGIGKVLGACFLVQRTYGAQAVDIAAKADIFCYVLRDYSPEKVKAALEKWILEYDDFPTPASIKKIIDPEPLMDGSVYRELVNKKKRGDFISDKEQRYMKTYQYNAMKGI